MFLHRTAKHYIILCMLLVVATLGKNTFNKNEEDSTPYSSEFTTDTAKITNNGSNCTPPSVEQFPRPFMDAKTRANGGICVHIIVALYMFVALSIICEEYFVPSLEKICDVLVLKPDVAGATFMAAGSSAPELATAVIAVFVAKDDIGLGAVIGSAVFNVMFVIAVCGLFSGMIVYLSWWPLFRDSFFYLVSIAALLTVIADERVDWYESIVLLLLYIIYCVVMYFNSSLESWVKSLHLPCFPSDSGQERTHLVTYNKMDEDGLQAENGSTGSPGIKTPDDSSAKLEDEGSVLEIPSEGRKKVLWLLALPLIFIFYITVPDCRKPRWHKWFIITFIMSLVWLSLFSYVMVWMITIIGYTLGIPDTVMGLTFLAAGVSVPDAITSLIVAKDGFGDMAVSNAVGSNIFDILICLGIPWFLQTVVIQPNSFVPVISKGLVYSTISLLSTVLFLLLSIRINGWKLDKKLGIALMIWYALFMVLAALYELNVFGYYNPPSCPSNY